MDSSIQSFQRSGHPGGRDRRDREAASSHIIGVLLLIAITMITGGIVLFVVNSQPLPEKVPMAYLGIAKTSEGIELVNHAGDPLTSTSIMILVDGIDRTSEFHSIGSAPGWGTLRPGDHISYKSTTPPASVQVIYASNTGQYLLASSGPAMNASPPVVTTPVPGQMIPAGQSSLVAGFVAQPVSGVTPLTVQFNDTSTGTPTSWAWTFGDEDLPSQDTSNQYTNPDHRGILAYSAQNPSHTYQEAGSYTVTLTVTNAAGTSTLTKTKYITVTPAAVNARIISATIPASMNTGQRYPVSVTVMNTGSMSWNEASMIRLGAVGDGAGDAAKFGPVRITIPAGTTVSPGSNYTFTFTMTAPATAGTVTPKYRMVWEGEQWFGEQLSTAVQLVRVTTVDAEMVSATLPASMNTGQKYPVTVTLRNTGNRSWNEATMIRLGAVGDGAGDAAKFGPVRVTIPAGTTVSPGSSYPFTFTMTAPATPGACTPKYRMVWEGEQWFGEQLSHTIQVASGPTVNAELVATSIPASMNAGQSYPVSVTMKNTGSMTWNEATMIRLGGVGDGAGDARQFGPSRMYIPAGTSVSPGSQYTFTFTMTAPAQGTYSPRYRMVWEGQQWFGEQASRTVQSIGPGNAPHAQFSVSISQDQSPLVVQFIDQSTGTGPLTYAWDFHNEGSVQSSEQSPTHTYRGVGLYSVKLTVTNAYGSDSETRLNCLEVLPLEMVQVPTAQFSANTTQGQSPLPVQFTDLSVATGTTSYAWDVNNDGVTDFTVKNPSHIYPVAGNFTVKLTVTNTSGSDSETKTQYIRVSSPVINTPPTAQFTASPLQGQSPLVVQFADQSVSGQDTSYQWDMNNDGVVDSTIKNPSHTYQAPGNYTVKLTVTNSLGSDTEIKTNLIKVTSLQSGDCYGAEACNPTGNPIGGGAGYTRTIAGTETSVKYVVSTKAELLTALKSAKAGETVFVRGSAVLDMTGTPSVTIPAGVTLASDRGRAGSAGALLKRTKNLNGGWEEPMFIVGGDNVRVTGLRLEGEQYPQDYGNDDVYDGSISEQYYLVGIYAENRKGFEVDNCEMYGWAWSCVSLRQNSGAPIPYIHHNYIHHNQARGEGYGVNLYGGNALIEANIFDYNRHAITGAGHTGEKYEARYNIVLGNGDAIGGHHFDIHQDENGGNFAGDKYLIHHNTFRKATDGGNILASVAIRQRPTTGIYIDHNLFEAVSTETEDGVPIWERDSTQNMFATNNKWMGKIYPTNAGLVWFL